MQGLFAAYYMRRRVVITGLGAVTPIGIGVDAFWTGLLEGRCGIGPVTLFDASDYPSRIAAEIRDWDPTVFMTRKRAFVMSRGTQFAVAAGRLALEHARWHGPQSGTRLGVVGGVANSPQDAIEGAVEAMQQRGYKRADPFVLVRCFAHSAAWRCAEEIGFRDYVFTISTACTSGLNAVAHAADVIRRGLCDVVLAVGADSLISKYVFGYFCKAGLLSQRNHDPLHASRPFDAKRDKGVMGEGAGALLLETEEHARLRNARIYGEILGYSQSGQDFTPALPEKPDGMVLVLCHALQAAGLSPERIDYIGANGVSDALLDALETQALKDALGEHVYRIPLSSVKGSIGIPTCAAGTLQFITSVLALNRNIIPPTINYEFPDPRCDLDYVPNTPRRATLTTALVLSHGLGGGDSAVVVQKWSD